ncbi:MAG: VacJ family lipoprotein [Alphaproteobacteria bacterium]|nr:MAG: VacJ family lipoprotein [Alphaproteobacteria bacterium]
MKKPAQEIDRQGRRHRATRACIGGPTAVASAMVLLAALALAACATKPPKSEPLARAAYEQANDPFEPLNRGIFTFNDTIDGLLFKPIAQGYRYVVPLPARRGLRNALGNLKMPWSFVNALLQGNFHLAGAAVARFIVNATVGVGGLFDPASRLGIPYVDEDLGQTLAVWGMGEGFYVVLPLLGPSSLRDGIGLIGEFFGDPASLAADAANVKGLQAIYLGLELLDAREALLDPYDQLMAESEDPYIAFRSVRRQNRLFKINNGRVAAQTGADPFEDDMFEQEFDADRPDEPQELQEPQADGMTPPPATP